MGEARLDGQKLVSIGVKPSTGATRLQFDIGAVLDLRRLRRDDSDEVWYLHTPENMYLSIYGDGTYSFGDGNSACPARHPLA